MLYAARTVTRSYSANNQISRLDVYGNMKTQQKSPDLERVECVQRHRTLSHGFPSPEIKNQKNNPETHLCGNPPSPKKSARGFKEVCYSSPMYTSRTKSGHGPGYIPPLLYCNNLWMLNTDITKELVFNEFWPDLTKCDYDPRRMEIPIRTGLQEHRTVVFKSV